MAEDSSAGTYQDVDAAIAALSYHQAKTAGSIDSENAEEEPAPVQHLHLSCCDIDNTAVAQIAAAITGASEAAHTIESVNMGWNDILGDSICSLVDSLLPLTGLTKLDLNYNSIGDDGAEQVAQLIHDGASLTFLDLVKNSINPLGVQAIAQALGKNRSLKALHLGMNNIGDEGLMHLAGALTTNESLLTLDVEINHIGPRGVEELGVVLSDINRSLTAINLQDNQIGDKGAVALASVLEYSETLGMLDIRTNEITNSGCDAIATALSKSAAPFIDLDIRSNKMDADVNSKFEDLSSSTCEIQVSWDSPATDDAEPENIPDQSELNDEEAAEAQRTVERMLGIIEDQSDIAFDNATWYLTKQPELANLMWELADPANESSMIRCLEIFRNLLEHSNQQQAEAFPATVLESCIYQLGPMISILEGAPANNPSLTSTFGFVAERFGSVRLCVVGLICGMIESQSIDVAEAICKTQALQVILHHFFQYEWHNMLHCCVSRIMCAVLISTQEAALMIRRHVFAPAEQGGCGLLQHMLDVYDEKCPAQSTEVDSAESPSPEHSRVISGTAIEKQLVTASLSCGYMSNVIEIAMMIYESSEFVSDFGSQELNDRWCTFSETVLQQLKPIQDECLGGGVPPQSAAPQCSQM